MRSRSILLIITILSQLASISWAGMGDKMFKKAGVPLLAAAAGGASLGIAYGTLLGHHRKGGKSGHSHHYHSYGYHK